MYIRLVLTVALMMAWADGIKAQDFPRLMHQKNFKEARQLAQQRLASDPKDEQAYWFLARASMSLAHDSSDFDKVADAIKPCLDAIPGAALCHLAMGEIYGSIAGSGGMFKGMRYAGSAKTEFLKAVELDPKNLTARSDLNQFYLQAPSVVGGGLDKAEGNTKAFETLRPNVAPLLHAQLHMQRGEFDQASKLLSTDFADADAADVQRDALTSLGFQLLQAKQADKALLVFENARSRFPDDASIYLGYGRSQLELEQVDKAIQSLQHAVALDPTRGAQYRLGIAQQTKGDKDSAIKSFREFLELRSSNANEQPAKDAKKRLADLLHG
jgi:tetratricopeptide (TPR) repeat protein